MTENSLKIKKIQTIMSLFYITHFLSQILIWKFIFQSSKFHIMGCVAMDIEGPKLTLYTSPSPVIDNLSDENKDKISDLIQIDDLMNMAVEMQKTGAKPNSQVSDSRMRWMMTHLCCRWDADNILEYLLKNYFLSNPSGYIDFVNAPTIEGYTCLHLCAMWQSQKCFYVLHHYGGLSLNAKDKMFKTPLECATQYKCAKMKQVLQSYRDIGVNFTQVESEKLISGEVISQDINENNKRGKKPQIKIPTIDTTKNSILGSLSDLEKTMIEQKKKLEKQKEEILQSKLKQQLQADAKKAKMLADNSKNQIQQFQKAEYQKKIKQQIDQESKKLQQKIAADLKAKEEELHKVKQQLVKKEEQRIKKEKQQAQKRAQEFTKHKQQQINKKIKEKEDAVNNLKKQQQERLNKQKQDTERRMKEAEEQFKKKQEQMKQQLKKKQDQIQKLKKDEQERLKKEKQSTQQKTKEAIKKAEEDYNKKLKEKQQQAKRFKEQETQRLKKQKQEAQKKAIQLAKQQNKQINQKANEAQKKSEQLKNTVEANITKAKETVNNATNQLKQAYDKIKEEVPSEINKAYTEAKSRGVYVDNQFPANNKSIGDPSKANFSNFTNNIVWLRPRDILKGDFKLFDGIDPNDVKQGSLGVCYMLATVSSLAANPKNIQKIFVFHDTSIGFYVLRLYVNGKPKYITIDDQIPCNKTTKSPLFTKPIGNQIWVLLLEKVWAKVVGDYLSAEAMTPDHVMEDLTSAPGFGSWFEKQPNKSQTEHIKTLVKHSKLGQIVVITSGDKKIEGIANNHAYTMLKVFETNGRYLFKIRNPWGQFQWNGQYGEKSSLWTPELKKLVGFQEKDDGIFHVSQNQLTNAYVYYSISQIKDNSFYSYAEFTSKKNEDLFFKFKKAKPGDVNIRITQLFDRMLKDKGYKYSPMVFEIGKINGDNNVKFISEGSQKSYFGAKSVHSTDNIFQTLEAGEYFIRIRMLWQNVEKYNSAILAVYTTDEYVTIQKLPTQKGSNYMKALMYSFASNIPKNQTGDGYYKIATMKGQFVFIGQTQKSDAYKITFTFTKGKMQMCQTDLGKISETQIMLTMKKGQPGVGTAMRTQPAKGGTTGPVNIQLQKA